MRSTALLLLCAGVAGCAAIEEFNEGCPSGQGVVGETAFALDVRKSTLRTTEARLGNLVADALLGTAAVADPTVVGAIQNAGGLRPELCEGGEREEIPAGPITDADVDQLLPFENYLAGITVTGVQLKSVLERSVSSLPEAEGWFLQVAGISFAADCTQAPQVLSVDETTIATEGARVSNITVGAVAWSTTGTYRLATNDYVAAGEDGFLALRAASSTVTSEVYTDVLKGWLEDNSPVAPAIEGRMVLGTSCTPP